MRIGSLFSGAGLCDYGFSLAGFEHAFFCECNAFCRSVLARHWPGVPVYNDVRALSGRELPRVDVLTGGFPCQDVSCAGLRRGMEPETRSGLWKEYARLIAEMRPRYAVIENVPGLRSKGMDRVLEDLARIGYDAQWQTVSAAAFGAPHIRDRLFIVAYPHRDRSLRKPGLLFAPGRDRGAQPHAGRLFAWSGAGPAGSGRKAARNLYRGSTICRVDDGRAGQLDGPVRLISRAEFKLYKARIMALGNGITPLQAWYVARCIQMDMGGCSTA